MSGKITSPNTQEQPSVSHPVNRHVSDGGHLPFDNAGPTSTPEISVPSTSTQTPSTSSFKEASVSHSHSQDKPSTNEGNHL